MNLLYKIKFKANDIIKNLYLNNRFYYGLGIVIIFFIISFLIKILFPVAQLLLIFFATIVIVDIFLLFQNKNNFKAERLVRKKMSLNHNHTASLIIESLTPMKLNVDIIDELPKELQKRNFKVYETFKPFEVKEIQYQLRPKKRGLYNFGKVLLFTSTVINIVKRRISIDNSEAIPVYPSLVEMKKFELYGKSNYQQSHGMKKIRRIGNSHEFEQIKTYVHGDDFQKINWKASSKGQGLMVNHYEDEKSQSVYLILDKSRNMKMPFNDLSLLDYSINTSLTIANTALKKKDKAGLITFSEKINTVLGSGSGNGQLEKILKALYNEKEGKFDANYEKLYKIIRAKLPVRSLLFLFTNFESKNSADQILPILRQISNRHLLVVIMFRNTELEEYSRKKPKNIEEQYIITQSEQLVYDKVEVVKKLQQYGIQTVFTTPKDLTVDVINKYIELKARGMI